MLFEDGSTLDADVVIFATGSVFLPFLRDNPVTRYGCRYADARKAYVDLIKNTDLHDKIRPIWGFDDEGEINSVGREIGGLRGGKAVAGLWCMMGNLAMCRFHSKHLALRTYLRHRARRHFSIVTRLLTRSIVEIKAYHENIFGVRYGSGN